MGRGDLPKDVNNYIDMADLDVEFNDDGSIVVHNYYEDVPYDNKEDFVKEIRRELNEYEVSCVDVNESMTVTEKLHAMDRETFGTDDYRDLLNLYECMKRDMSSSRKKALKELLNRRYVSTRMVDTFLSEDVAGNIAHINNAKSVASAVKNQMEDSFEYIGDKLESEGLDEKLTSDDTVLIDPKELEEPSEDEPMEIKVGEPKGDRKVPQRPVGKQKRPKERKPPNTDSKEEIPELNKYLPKDKRKDNRKVKTPLPKRKIDTETGEMSGVSKTGKDVLKVAGKGAKAGAKALVKGIGVANEITKPVRGILRTIGGSGLLASMETGDVDKAINECATSSKKNKK